MSGIPATLWPECEEFVSLNEDPYFQHNFSFSDYQDFKEDPEPSEIVDALLEVLPYKKRNPNLKRGKTRYPNRKNRVKLSHEKFLTETLIDHNGEIESDETDIKPIQEDPCWSCQFCKKLQDAKFSEYFG